MARFPAFILLPLITAACAGPEGSPPSLGPRPVEGILDQPVYAIAPIPSASDPALAARIDRLAAEAEQGEQAFAAVYAATESAVAAAAGSGIESEPWIAAHIALSALDSARSPTTTALGDLDGMLAEQAITAQPVEIERLDAARQRVATLHENQSARYEALLARLR